MNRLFCLPPIQVSKAELLMFRLRAHLTGKSIADYVRVSGREVGTPAKRLSGYCAECGDHSVTEPVPSDYRLPNGAVVQGVPACRCSKCGTVYEDVQLGAILDEDADFLPPGKNVLMAELLAPAS